MAHRLRKPLTFTTKKNSKGNTVFSLDSGPLNTFFHPPEMNAKLIAMSEINDQKAAEAMHRFVLGDEQKSDILADRMTKLKIDHRDYDRAQMARDFIHGAHNDLHRFGHYSKRYETESNSTKLQTQTRKTMLERENEKKILNKKELEDRQNAAEEARRRNLQAKINRLQSDNHSRVAAKRVQLHTMVTEIMAQRAHAAALKQEEAARKRERIIQQKVERVKMFSERTAGSPNQVNDDVSDTECSDEF